ncbi:MAG TPA: SRPBCC family protein [Candidatus Binataceae bacterium]|nr:SRPBCC family protein [Candidatus Binataceae bacterium]
MSTVQKSIDLNVPVSTAYNQWTQFEEFPRFMEGVKSVRQLDEKRLHWVTQIGGKEESFDAIIDQQVPDQRIAWHSTIGPKQGGVVTFHRLGDDKTRVMLQMEYEPQGLVEKAGDMLGAVSMRIQGDLDRFKKFLESRGTETGGWRGEVHR